MRATYNPRGAEMKIDLTLLELKTIKHALENTFFEYGELMEVIDKGIADCEELDNIDLDDCASGACKL
jgi:hypothetical protein